MLEQFLNFMARDLARRPERVRSVDRGLVERIQSLVGQVEVDLDSAPVVINGWSIFAHPLFLAQVEELIGRVDALRKRDPGGYVRKNDSKRLAAILKWAFEVIAHDPTRAEYRQGGSLGGANKHWFRAKFLQQYRLFFRYHVESRIIVFAWVNDEDTKRACLEDEHGPRYRARHIQRPERGGFRLAWRGGGARAAPR